MYTLVKLIYIQYIYNKMYYILEPFAMNKSANPQQVNKIKRLNEASEKIVDSCETFQKDINSQKDMDDQCKKLKKNGQSIRVVLINIWHQKKFTQRNLQKQKSDYLVIQSVKVFKCSKCKSKDCMDNKIGPKHLCMLCKEIFQSESEFQ